MPVNLSGLARSQQRCIAFGCSQKTLFLHIFQLETTLISWQVVLSPLLAPALYLSHTSICIRSLINAFSSIIKTLLVALDPYTSSPHIKIRSLANHFLSELRLVHRYQDSLWTFLMAIILPTISCIKGVNCYVSDTNKNAG